MLAWTAIEGCGCDVLNLFKGVVGSPCTLLNTTLTNTEEAIGLLRFA